MELRSASPRCASADSEVGRLARRPRVRLRCGLGVGLALALLAAAAAPADRSAELAQLRAAVREARERVGAYEREGRGLLQALEALDRARGALEEEVRRAGREAEQARRALSGVEAEAERLAERLEATRRAMSARAVGLYKAGQPGALRMLFSAGGLREFLSRVYALRRLLGHDAELLARYRRESEALAAVRVRARTASEAHVAAVAELGSRSAELEAERGRKRDLLARAGADRSRERALLIELETAARALEKALGGLDVAAGAGDVDGPPFASLRGRLAPPVPGRIARRFGRVVDEEFRTETFRKGIDFAAPAGTPVRAVAAGRVRFAGWFGGYGQLVILDHGDAYFSVSGHLAEVRVASGEAVASGAPIGRVGETGSLSGARLYFEIRRAEEPLDPAEWLGPRRPR